MESILCSGDMTTTTVHQPRATATSVSPVDRVTAIATIAAPVLLLAASIAWLADAAEARAILTFWALIGFAGAFVGISRRLTLRAPTAAAIVLAFGLVGVAGGIGYATEIAMVDAFGIDRLNDQELASTYLLLRLPGLTFPLALVLSGLLGWRNGLLRPAHALVLGLGAVAFPMSRVPELPGPALIADVVLIVALVPIGWMVLRGETEQT